MAGELQRDIREDARKRQAAAPVTRAVAREVMVRTPLFARILSQFWMFVAVVQARAPAPELRNTDDEAIVFCEVRFPLKGDEARVAAVLDGLEEFEREEDGVARWIWFAAGSPLHRAARHRRGRPVAESSESAIGTTSIGYAETRKGRARVIDWLKQLENTEHRRAALTREERATLRPGTLPAGRRCGRRPAAVPDVRRRVREPGIAMAAAVHGVLCTCELQRWRPLLPSGREPQRPPPCPVSGRTLRVSRDDGTMDG